MILLNLLQDNIMTDIEFRRAYLKHIFYMNKNKLNTLRTFSKLQGSNVKDLLHNKYSSVYEVILSNIGAVIIDTSMRGIGTDERLYSYFSCDINGTSVDIRIQKRKEQLVFMLFDTFHIDMSDFKEN